MLLKISSRLWYSNLTWYLSLNAVANQLRYPNTHTHYSFFLLHLFAESNQFSIIILSKLWSLNYCFSLHLKGMCNFQQEIIQEQITSLLLERLIVNRPHPWGLLITHIELIKVRSLNTLHFSCFLVLSKFWLVFVAKNVNRILDTTFEPGFIRSASEIEKLVESVLRSCAGLKPSVSLIKSTSFACFKLHEVYLDDSLRPRVALWTDTKVSQ